MKKLAIGVSWISMTLALTIGSTTIARAADDTGHTRIGLTLLCASIKHWFKCKETT